MSFKVRLATVAWPNGCVQMVELLFGDALARKQGWLTMKINIQMKEIVIERMLPTAATNGHRDIHQDKCPTPTITAKLPYNTKVPRARRSIIFGGALSGRRNSTVGFRMHFTNSQFEWQNCHIET